MLTSLVLQLQATETITLPSHLGRASQGLLVRLVGRYDAILAGMLQTPQQIKPFTASPLMMGRRQRGQLSIAAHEMGWLRFTGLTSEISQILQLVSQAPPASVELEGYRLSVIGATLNPNDHVWARQVSYQDLAAPYLLGAIERLPQALSLEFISPTTFRSQDMFLPLPQPSLIFGSLLDRWEAFVPIALHHEVRRYIETTLSIAQFEARSVTLSSKDKGQLVGFMGHVRFVTPNHDRYWLNILHLLADFAFYSGVGYLTTGGLGQVRRKDILA